MKCNYCNNEVRDGALFCSNCGAPITPQNKKPDKKKLIIIIVSVVVAVVALIGASIAVFAHLSNRNDNEYLYEIDIEDDNFEASVESTQNVETETEAEATTQETTTKEASKTNFDEIEEMLPALAGSYVGGFCNFREYSDGICYVDNEYRPTGVYKFSFKSNKIEKKTDIDFDPYECASATLLHDGVFLKSYNMFDFDNEEICLIDYQNNKKHLTDNDVMEFDSSHIYTYTPNDYRNEFQIDGQAAFAFGNNDTTINSLSVINGKIIVCTTNWNTEKSTIYQMSNDGTSIDNEIVSNDYASYYVTEKYLYYSNDKTIYKYDPSTMKSTKIVDCDTSIGALYFVYDNRAYFIYQNRNSDGFTGGATIYYADLSTGKSVKVGSCDVPLGGY